MRHTRLGVDLGNQAHAPTSALRLQKSTMLSQLSYSAYVYLQYNLSAFPHVFQLLVWLQSCTISTSMLLFQLMNGFLLVRYASLAPTYFYWPWSGRIRYSSSWVRQPHVFNCLFGCSHALSTSVVISADEWLLISQVHSASPYIFLLALVRQDQVFKQLGQVASCFQLFVWLRSCTKHLNVVISADEWLLLVRRSASSLLITYFYWPWSGRIRYSSSWVRYRHVWFVCGHVVSGNTMHASSLAQT